MKSLKPKIRTVIGKIPGGSALIAGIDRSRMARAEKNRLQSLGAISDIFLHHYLNNEWRSKESVSGSGSTLTYTENVRTELPKLVFDLGVDSFLDAPCGDFNWFQTVIFPHPVKYIGGDIVGPLIDELQARFHSQERTFVQIDITRDSLPAVDLWMCRDCLFHLSQKNVLAALRNFANSNIKYLLTSTHFDCKINNDIPNGGFRQLNLCLPPYSLSAPIRTIDDWIEGFPKRQLGLWERKVLALDLTIQGR